MTRVPAYIIAARRSALGRLGGLHARRRIEDLAAPIIVAALGDGKIDASRVESLIVGNGAESGNPARLIALAAGLPESASALTIDRQCGSGLDAIVMAHRCIGDGEADIIVAGGAEALTTAPWRLAKPKLPHLTPRFVGFEPSTADTADEPQGFDASERLARTLKIGRPEQDAYALRSHVKAEAAREAKRFVGEIVPIRSKPEEARDESAREPMPEDLEDLAPFFGPEGTLTPGNTSALHDGAAFVVIVSERIWTGLGRPRALQLVQSVACGVTPEREAAAPMTAIKRLFQRLPAFDKDTLTAIELSESSAAQAIALAREFGFNEGQVNRCGGAIVRGHPLGAASAVLVVRLFTELVRDAGPAAQSRGLAALGTIGGMGLAALFEAT